MHGILGYRKIQAHYEVQQCHHYAVAQGLLNRYQRKSGDFIIRIVAMDETLDRSHEPHLKGQSNKLKHPGSPRPKKVRPTQSAVKVMFIVAYDIDGALLHHAVPPGQIVNAAYYCTFQQHHLRPALWRKRRHLVVQKPIIPYDNARSHPSAVTDLLCRLQWDILEHPQHPPYPPNMSQCDYALFANVKEPLRGTRYNTRDELIRAIGRIIRNTNKDERSDGVRRLIII